MLLTLPLDGYIVLQVDMTKVRLEVVKPWVTEKITAILGMEDDVVIEYVFNQLEAEKVSVVGRGGGCPSGCECACVSVPLFSFFPLSKRSYLFIYHHKGMSMKDPHAHPHYLHGVCVVRFFSRSCYVVYNSEFPLT